MEISAPKAAEIGLRLISVNMKDIMFPGNLKEIFAQLVKAKGRVWPPSKRPGERPPPCAI
jgi:hypothetical protein